MSPPFFSVCFQNTSKWKGQGGPSCHSVKLLVLNISRNPATLDQTGFVTITRILKRFLCWQSHIDQLCQIVKFHLAPNGLGGLIQIVMTEGTNGDHVLGTRLHSFLDSE